MPVTVSEPGHPGPRRRCSGPDRLRSCQLPGPVKNGMRVWKVIRVASECSQSPPGPRHSYGSDYSDPTTTNNLYTYTGHIRPGPTRRIRQASLTARTCRASSSTRSKQVVGPAGTPSSAAERVHPAPLRYLLNPQCCLAQAPQDAAASLAEQLLHTAGRDTWAWHIRRKAVESLELRFKCFVGLS